ncbi:MAG: hypothetical protein J6W52_04820 [Bacteroidaceae bacterium]|nr:hypothetical protein [Bacteroidaceae bacterium]
MKKILFILMSCLGCVLVHAQDYSLTSEGVDNNGNFVVRIVVSTKKPAKMAEDLVKQYAVHGVMFRGVAAAKDYSGQPPLVKDPNVEQTKKAWFNAFWNEGGYKRYATITPSSMSVMKNKQTKMTETSALVVVSSSLLKAYLEEEGVIQGLSNLW